MMKVRIDIHKGKNNVVTRYAPNSYEMHDKVFDTLYNKILLKIGSNKVLNKTKEQADEILRSFFRTETA